MIKTGIYKIREILRAIAWFHLFMLATIASGIESVQAQDNPSKFLPDNVTRSMDRDQMLSQLDLALPALPEKSEDPNAPRDAFPKDSLNPEGNWTNIQGHTIVRSAWGLWNNYHDYSKGFFPGTDSARLGDYTPIDLLKMNDGGKVNTVEQWWNKRQPEWPTFFDFASKYIKSPMSTGSPFPDAKTELPRIESRVYKGFEKNERNESGQTTNIFKGSTTHLAYFEVNSIALSKGAELEQSDAHLDFEELIIIKEGRVSITINDQPRILGPGSIAFILPEDGYRLKNIGSANTHYYSLKYRSKSPMDLARGKKAGGSFAVDWNEVAYKEHDKGGRRDFFDRPTAMCEDFEMHVTNLNENTSSHAPHTHDVEEIILMVQGDIRMHVDGKEQHATANDLAFLDSNVPHAPTNIGDGQCIYFAFQWK